MAPAAPRGVPIPERSGLLAGAGPGLPVLAVWGHGCERKLGGDGRWQAGRWRTFLPNQRARAGDRQALTGTHTVGVGVAPDLREGRAARGVGAEKRGSVGGRQGADGEGQTDPMATRADEFICCASLALVYKEKPNRTKPLA